MLIYHFELLSLNGRNLGRVETAKLLIPTFPNLHPSFSYDSAFQSVIPLPVANDLPRFGLSEHTIGDAHMVLHHSRLTSGSKQDPKAACERLLVPEENLEKAVTPTRASCERQIV